MSAPVWTSELGKSFWRNVRLGNIQCEFDERAPSGLWKAYEKEDGTLLTGSYYPRPSTKPLDCDLTKSGFHPPEIPCEGCAGWGRQTRESEGSMGLHRSWTESGLDAWEDWTPVGPRDSEPSPPTEDS